MEKTMISKIVSTPVRLDDPNRMNRIRWLGVQARMLDNPVGRSFVAVLDRLFENPALNTKEAIDIIMGNIK